MPDELKIDSWEDGEEYIIPFGQTWVHACCDCCLVHNVTIRVTEEGIGFTFQRDEEVTQDVRDMVTAKQLKESMEVEDGASEV